MVAETQRLPRCDLVRVALPAAWCGLCRTYRYGAVRSCALTDSSGLSTTEAVLYEGGRQAGEAAGRAGQRGGDGCAAHHTRVGHVVDDELGAGVEAVPTKSGQEELDGFKLRDGCATCWGRGAWGGERCPSRVGLS